MQQDEEGLLYDVESLFTKIPVKKTIDYIIDQIYVHKKLTPICTKLIFKRLLLKLVLNANLLFRTALINKLTDVKWAAHSVIFSDIYMVKLENYSVESPKPKFYRRYVDDMCNRKS